MIPVFTRNERVVEKSILEKSYFSEREQVTFRDKCFIGLLSFLLVLLVLNIYQTINSASVIEIIF